MAQSGSATNQARRKALRTGESISSFVAEEQPLRLPSPGTSAGSCRTPPSQTDSKKQVSSGPRRQDLGRVDPPAIPSRTSSISGRVAGDRWLASWVLALLVPSSILLLLSSRDNLPRAQPREVLEALEAISQDSIHHRAEALPFFEESPNPGASGERHPHPSGAGADLGTHEMYRGVSGTRDAVALLQGQRDGKAREEERDGEGEGEEEGEDSAGGDRENSVHPFGSKQCRLKPSLSSCGQADVVILADGTLRRRMDVLCVAAELAKAWNSAPTSSPAAARIRVRVVWAVDPARSSEQGTATEPKPQGLAPGLGPLPQGVTLQVVPETVGRFRDYFLPLHKEASLVLSPGSPGDRAVILEVQEGTDSQFLPPPEFRRIDVTKAWEHLKSVDVGPEQQSKVAAKSSPAREQRGRSAATRRLLWATGTSRVQPQVKLSLQRRVGVKLFQQTTPGIKRLARKPGVPRRRRPMGVGDSGSLAVYAAPGVEVDPNAVAGGQGLRPQCLGLLRPARRVREWMVPDLEGEKGAILRNSTGLYLEGDAPDTQTFARRAPEGNMACRPSFVLNCTVYQVASRLLRSRAQTFTVASLWASQARAMRGAFHPSSSPILTLPGLARAALCSGEDPPLPIRKGKPSVKEEEEEDRRRKEGGGAEKKGGGEIRPWEVGVVQQLSGGARQNGQGLLHHTRALLQLDASDTAAHDLNGGDWTADFPSSLPSQGSRRRLLAWPWEGLKARGGKRRRRRRASKRRAGKKSGDAGEAASETQALNAFDPALNLSRLASGPKGKSLCSQLWLAELFLLSHTRNLLRLDEQSLESRFITAQVEARGGGASPENTAPASEGASPKTGGMREGFRERSDVVGSVGYGLITQTQWARFMLIDETVGYIFCHIPKVASSKWKYWLNKAHTLVLSSGLRGQQSQPRAPHPQGGDRGSQHMPGEGPQQQQVNEGQEQIPELATWFSEAEAIRQVTRRDLFRFVFVRNPFARAASAYLDKHVYGGEQRDRKYWNQLFFHSCMNEKVLEGQEETEEPLEQKKNLEYLWGQPEQMPFKGFVAHLQCAARLYRTMEPHISPQASLCNLHGIEYDFVGRMETLEEDAHAALMRMGEKAGLPTWLAHAGRTHFYFTSRSKHATHADSKVSKLYAGDEDTISSVKQLYGVDLSVPLNNVTYFWDDSR